MIYGLETIVTFTLAIISFLIVLGTQIHLSTVYKESKLKKNGKKLTGCEVAGEILRENGLEDIYIVEVAGELSDHYDPSRRVIRLSHDVFHGETIAALAIAAHECGHALQDKENYTFMRIRAALVPFVNLVTYLGYFGLIISLFAGVIGYLKISMAILIIVLLFQLVTLPVEFDASRRALKEIERLSLAGKEEKEMTENMLKAAAMTYVASLISLVIDLLRLVLMLQDRER